MVDLLIPGNVHLEVVVPILPFIPEGPKFVLKLSGTSLSKAGPKEHDPQLLVSGTDIAGLAKLINAGLCSCILRDNLELSKAQSTWLS